MYSCRDSLPHPRLALSPSLAAMDQPGQVSSGSVALGDYAKPVRSMTYRKVGHSIFPYDHYAFWRECPAVDGQHRHC
jgi:hypothetical protein